MELKNIELIAKKLNLSREDIIFYGDYKAKLKPIVKEKTKNNKDAKLVLVTAITPTKAGEGKTTTTIALSDALNKLNHLTLPVLREPSLGPTFGLKGGATGGGKAIVEPEMDINLHFTGDMHALTTSINLISAVIDNHIYQGNELNIDKDRILWKRALDCNDRELRNITIGEGKETDGIVRKEHFVITVASELMAILCIAKDEKDFINRVNEILFAYDKNGNPLYLKFLHIENAIYMLMKDALLPNLVQTGENNPCLIHGGPFANIAHGCASLIATNYALKLADIVVEEAGFGADLGAEKFFDIKCREGNLKPSCVVLVATIRALKLHGDTTKKLDEEDLLALKNGMENLKKHYSNLRKFNLPIVVAINHFATDSEKEIKLLMEELHKENIKFAFLDGFMKGSEGSVELANKVLEALDTSSSSLKFIYDKKCSIKEKIETIAKSIYGAKEVVYNDKALNAIKEIEKINKDDYVVCMAKTPLSFSDDPKKLNVTSGFNITVTDLYISNGAKFIVALCGNVLTLPGLPKVPRAIDFK